MGVVMTILAWIGGALVAVGVLMIVWVARDVAKWNRTN